MGVRAVVGIVTDYSRAPGRGSHARPSHGQSGRPGHRLRRSRVSLPSSDSDSSARRRQGAPRVRRQSTVAVLKVAAWGDDGPPPLSLRTLSTCVLKKSPLRTLPVFTSVLWRIGLFWSCSHGWAQKFSKPSLSSVSGPMAVHAKTILQLAMTTQQYWLGKQKQIYIQVVQCMPLLFSVRWPSG
jgi:hypothetical protein